MAKPKRRQHPKPMAAAVVPAERPATRRRWPLVLAALGVVALAIGIAVRAWPDRVPAKIESAQVAKPSAELIASLKYVGSGSCASCHATETANWKKSDHFRSMAEADSANVVGDFNDAKFTYGNVTSTFFKRGESYFVRTDGPDGKLADYPIKYTFGFKPLQQYLIELPGGRLQALSITWDARPKGEGGQRWFHQYPGHNIRAGDPLHWTGRDQNWNFQCAACHSTDLVKNYDRAKHTYDTKYSEINVGCEACHGPASAHLEWTAKKPVAAALAATKGFAISLKDPPGTWRFEEGRPIARYTGTAPKSAEMNACWSCHSRRGQIAEPIGHDKPFLDAHRPAWLEAGLYYADGQQRGEVFTWGSFVQSKMYQAGVTCGNCHDPHSSQLRAPGNGVCLQCHQAAVFDTEAHVRHPAGTAGAQCANCHMPATIYMGIDARHDHSFKVPRPDQTVAYQVPNACNSCHRDKTPEWAASTVAAWFPAHRNDNLAVGVMAGAAERRDGYEANLNALIANPTMPSLVRATAIAQLPGDMSRRSIATIERASGDVDPLVRAAALRQLRPFPAAERLRLAVPRLTDSVRLVRVEAAYATADLSPAQLGASAPARDAAVAEAIAAELAHAERPEALMNLSALYALSGRTAEAEAALKDALIIDPQSIAVRVNLADLYRRLGRDTEGEPLLREAVKLAPQSPDVQHALALYLVRSGKTKEALPLLERSAKLAPNNSRYGYVYAVALNSFGNSGAAIAVLKGINKTAPDDRAVLQALASIERDRGNAEASETYTAKLRELDQR